MMDLKLIEGILHYINAFKYLQSSGKQSTVKLKPSTSPPSFDLCTKAR